MDEGLSELKKSMKNIIDNNLGNKIESFSDELNDLSLEDLESLKNELIKLKKNHVSYEISDKLKGEIYKKKMAPERRPSRIYPGVTATSRGGKRTYRKKRKSKRKSMTKRNFRRRS